MVPSKKGIPAADAVLPHCLTGFIEASAQSGGEELSPQGGMQEATDTKLPSNVENQCSHVPADKVNKRFMTLCLS